MVSIVLLTTEEVLHMNQFWYQLDTAWITEEMEPFEDIKPEHMFIKPLSRDSYYAKYPDMPRSDSEDENTISLITLKRKHIVWKSKAYVRRFDARRLQLCKSTCNLKISSGPIRNASSRRVRSLVELNTVDHRSVDQDSGRIKAFLNRLFESISPPPIEELKLNKQYNLPTHRQPNDNFLNIDLPDYGNFVHEKIIQNNILLPSTSTLKKINYRKVKNRIL